MRWSNHERERKREIQWTVVSMVRQKQICALVLRHSCIRTNVGVWINFIEILKWGITLKLKYENWFYSP